MPQWQASKGHWIAGRLQLRGERDIRDLFCIDTQAGGGWASGNDPAIVCEAASFGYRGGLKILCVPRGSEWEVELSDMPVARQLAPSSHNFVGSNYTPRQRTAQPKVEGA